MRSYCYDNLSLAGTEFNIQNNTYAMVQNGTST